MCLSPSSSEKFCREFNFALCALCTLCNVGRRKSHTSKRESERRSVVLSSLSHSSARHGPEKKEIRKWKLRNCNKKDEWYEDMIYGRLVYICVYVMSYVALLWNSHFILRAVIISSFSFTGFISFGVIWWPIYCIYCVLSEIHFWGGSSRY